MAAVLQLRCVTALCGMRNTRFEYRVMHFTIENNVTYDYNDSCLPLNGWYKCSRNLFSVHLI